MQIMRHIFSTVLFAIGPMLAIFLVQCSLALAAVFLDWDVLLGILLILFVPWLIAGFVSTINRSAPRSVGHRRDHSCICFAALFWVCSCYSYCVD